MRWSCVVFFLFNLLMWYIWFSSVGPPLRLGVHLAGFCTLLTSRCLAGDVPVDVPRDRGPWLCAWRRLPWRRARGRRRGGRKAALLLGFPLEVFEEEQCSFFCRCVVAFTREAICSWTFLCWEMFDDQFNVLAHYNFIQILYFFLSQFFLLLVKLWQTFCGLFFSLHLALFP